MPPKIKGIAFDIFGTVVDWFGSIVEIGSAASGTVDWKSFAIGWLKAYRVEQVRKRERPWAPLDTLLNEGFAELSQQFDLSGLSPSALRELATAWHRLKPWSDVTRALERLRERFRIGALSNANTLLLVDMAKAAKLPWDCIASAEMPKKYKPEPEVYVLACESLGDQRDEVLYVASHKWDLQAGQALGMRSAYIPRPLELGDGGPPPEDPSPDPSFDFFAKDFLDLAQQLLA